MHEVDDAWEMFDRRTARAAKGQPVVSIQKRGTFGFNRAAWEALGEPAAVALMYNRQTNAIGFVPAPEEDPRSYPIRTQARGSSYQVAGKAFLQTYGLYVPDYSRRHRAEMRGDILVVDFNQDDTTVAEDGEE